MAGSKRGEFLSSFLTVLGPTAMAKLSRYVHLFCVWSCPFGEPKHAVLDHKAFVIIYGRYLEYQKFADIPCVIFYKAPVFPCIVESPYAYRTLQIKYRDWTQLERTSA